MECRGFAETDVMAVSGARMLLWLSLSAGILFVMLSDTKNKNLSLLGTKIKT